jgi:hypothetical protein
MTFGGPVVTNVQNFHRIRLLSTPQRREGRQSFAAYAQKSGGESKTLLLRSVDRFRIGRILALNGYFGLAVIASTFVTIFLASVVTLRV